MDEVRYREAEQRLWQSVGVSPTERMIRLERNDVVVRVQEVGEGPAVVFVHGGSNSGTSWATLVGRLNGFRCVLVDRPGCGLSDLLPATLELGSAHLVATSLGGYVGLRTAAAHPDRIGRMVQFSWPIGAPIAKLPAFMRLASVPVLRNLPTVLPSSDRSVRMMFRRIGHAKSLDAGRISQELIDAYVALLRHTDTMRNELASAASFIGPLRGLNPRLLLPDDLLGGIQTPTLFLWGENDPFGGVDTARRLVELMPHASLEVLSDAGHAPWLDDPDFAADAITRFLGL